MSETESSGWGGGEGVRASQQGSRHTGSCSAPTPSFALRTWNTCMPKASAVNPSNPTMPPPASNLLGGDLLPAAATPANEAVDVREAAGDT